jgi:hypothetical protein
MLSQLREVPQYRTNTQSGHNKTSVLWHTRKWTPSQWGVPFAAPLELDSFVVLNDGKRAVEAVQKFAPQRVVF